MKLEVLQRYAEKVAEKLELKDKPTVRWFKKGECGRDTGTHIHIDQLVPDNSRPRGTICIERKEDPRGWRWIMAHEVCHLKVKSHSSPYFDRYMATLGFAKEKREAQRAGVLRHKHDWRWQYRSGCGANEIKQYCAICQVTRIGTITWGKLS